MADLMTRLTLDRGLEPQEGAERSIDLRICYFCRHGSSTVRVGEKSDVFRNRRKLAPKEMIDHVRYTKIYILVG